MEAGNNTPQGSAPQPQPDAQNRPTQPIVRRPVVDGFVARRPQNGMHPASLMPTGAPALSSHPRPVTHVPISGTTPAPQPVHIQPMQHQAVQPPAAPLSPPHHQTQFAHTPQAQPMATRPTTPPVPNATTAAAVVTPASAPVSPALAQHSSASTLEEEQPLAKGRGPREKNRTGHAGWVGFGVFILLGALLVSPLLPDKVVNSFPLSSSTFSTGDSNLDCLGKQGQISSTTKYTSKAGSPVAYTSATSTTQSATCDGRPQSAEVGRSSQFNVLGLVIDVVVALVVAIIAARIWRLIFGEKQHSSRHRDE